MRLLCTKEFKLEEFGGKEVPQYAILSHTWGKEEVTLQDVKMGKSMELEGYQKVKNACSVAAANGFNYIWIDTCCIDKTSSAELSEALNSMFRWYEEAEECYAYLADVPPNSINRVASVIGSNFRESRWFTRGWTLQELIAPLSVQFLDKEWQEIGTKLDLQQTISEITGIPGSFLLGDELRHASVAQRMSWASMRETTRIEDLAYCLMGLFGIYMPMLYGEGERAFIRLQEEIMKVSDDHSLFAWRSMENHGGILATSPAAFANSGNIIPIPDATSSPSTPTSRGVHLSLRFIDTSQQGNSLAILHCSEIGKESKRLAIHLRDVFLTKQDFIREQSSRLELIHLENTNGLQHPLRSIYVRPWHPTRKRTWGDIEKCVIKLEGVEVEEVALRIANLDSDCKISKGLIVMDIAAIPDGILSRLLIVCKDRNVFQILLKKNGISLSADIHTGTNTQDLDVPENEQNDQTQFVKVLGNGQHVRIAIENRVYLLSEGRCLIGVVEISYSNTVEGIWLEHIAVLEKVIKQTSLLSYAALRGLEVVVKHLLDREIIDEAVSKDECRRTALSWAAEGGQEAVVKFLLETGKFDVNAKDKDGRTPLSWAAGTGHEAVVRLLLAKVAKAAVLEKDEENSGNRRPLSRGLWHRLLPTNGAKINTRDSLGRTPLLWAIANGHSDVVKLLLETGKVRADGKDRYGQTPLLWAAQSGHDAVVKVLLEHQVEANTKDEDGRTLLSWAAENGHEAVAKLLLDHQVEADAKDNYGQTPLFRAAVGGHEDVVKLLLEIGKVRADVKDRYGQTPLFRAAASGHEAVVELLLKTGQIDVNIKDKYGRTPLFIAAESGHDAIIKLLLDHQVKINDAKDKDSWTPLFRAASSGHEAVVKLLLETGQVKTDVKHKYGQTSLLNPIASGHETIV
jgi:ankyrin repeat protein